MIPILINKGTCALILIYERYSEMFEAVHGAYNGLDHKGMYELAAREFIKQLGGRQTKGFLKALKNEIEKCLKEE